jgi:hypothetical protein
MAKKVIDSQKSLKNPKYTKEYRELWFHFSVDL